MSITKKQASQIKKGGYFMIEGESEPFMLLSSEHAKSGKHGHAKNRIECVGLFTGKRKSVNYASDEMLDVPEILKKQGQVVDINPDVKKVTIMDLQDLQTIEIDYPVDEEDTDVMTKLAQLVENKDLMGEAQVEYWDVMGKKFVTRVLITKN